MLTTVGAGARQQVRLNPDYRLAGAIRELFRAERGRYEHLFDELKAAVKGINGIDAAWVENLDDTVVHRAGDALTLGLLASAEQVDDIGAALREIFRSLSSARM